MIGFGKRSTSFKIRVFAYGGLFGSLALLILYVVVQS